MIYEQRFDWDMHIKWLFINDINCLFHSAFGATMLMNGVKMIIWKN